MKHGRHSDIMKMAFYLGVVTVMLMPLAGCEEADMAIDVIFGKQLPVLSASAEMSPQSFILAKRREAGEKASTGIEAAVSADQKPAAIPAKTKPWSLLHPAGKETASRPAVPGYATGGSACSKEAVGTSPGERNPFKPPTEILPSECPPSMPLCRFDRSQLKLVGVIQVSEGEFKGMVEDPDGRGYFVTTGMQIGGATVTQVNDKGITLHLHRTHQDVMMPLFKEAKKAGEF